MPSTAERIGGDWVRNTTKNEDGTSSVYYANVVTKESSWEWPASLPPPPNSSTTSTPAPPPTSTAATSEWVEKLDTASQSYYYYNKTSKETTWEKPAQYRPAVPATTDAAPKGDWASKLDAATGVKYYYNKVTKETTWDQPADYNPLTDPVSQPPQPPGQGLSAMNINNNGGAESDSDGDELNTSAGQGSDILGGDDDEALPMEDRDHVNAGCQNLPSVEEVVKKLSANDTFDKYVESFFKLDRKGMFKRQTSVSKISQWKDALIKTSLLQLPPDLSSESLQTFRNVTGYMGDRGSTKEPLGHVLKILNALKLSPDSLRDEVYCQIIKQSNGNPSHVCTVRGWQLMCIMLSSFPPSATLVGPLTSYCNDKRKDSAFVTKYAEFTIRRIPRILTLGVRREIPTQVELEALKRCAKMTVRVHFLDGRYLMIQTDSWTTATEFSEHVARKLGVVDESPYCLYEVSSDEHERALEGDERVLDLVAYWHRLSKEEGKGQGKGAKVLEYRFVFKVRLFFEIDDEDRAGIEMMYLQAYNDVVDARYPCSEQDSLTLAALQLQELFGDHPGSGRPFTELDGVDPVTGNPKLMKFLAQKYFDQGRDEELILSITNLYIRLSGYSQQESRLSYLDYVRSWKIYGSAYFFAEPQNSALRFPAAIVLAVNAKGILIVDPDSKEFLAEYTFKDCVTWGHSSNSFVVVTGGVMKQTKIYFKTDQGKEINAVVKSYVERILGGAKGEAA